MAKRKLRYFFAELVESPRWPINQDCVLGSFRQAVKISANVSYLLRLLRRGSCVFSVDISRFCPQVIVSDISITFWEFHIGYLWLPVSLRMLKQRLPIHLRLTSALICPILFLSISNKETIRLTKTKPQLEELESKMRCYFSAWTHIRLNAVLFLVIIYMYRWLIFSFTITIFVNICVVIHNNKQLLYIV